MYNAVVVDETQPKQNKKESVLIMKINNKYNNVLEGLVRASVVMAEKYYEKTNAERDELKDLVRSYFSANGFNLNIHNVADRRLPFFIANGAMRKAQGAVKSYQEAFNYIKERMAIRNVHLDL